MHLDPLFDRRIPQRAGEPRRLYGRSLAEKDASSEARRGATLGHFRGRERHRFLLPDFEDVRIERAWGGPIDVSADRFPFFGTVPGTRVHYGAGYSGNGVGPSWLGGQILARLALRIEDELTGLPLVNRRVRPLPPEPLKGWGGALVRGAALRVEEAEQAGGRASLPLRAIAALPRVAGLRIGTR